MSRIPVFALALPMLASLELAAYAERRDGRYEITTTMRMPGMPALPPTTHQQCLTGKDPVPHPPRRGAQDCSVIDVKRSGDEVSWHVKCADARGTYEGTGRLQYAGDSFSGSIVLKMEKKGEKMEMTQTLEGHRVGDCAGAK